MKILGNSFGVLLVLLIAASHIAANDTGQSISIKQVEEDVWIVVGGSFTPDHVGVELYEQMKARIIQNAAVYNAFLAEQFLSSDSNLRTISKYHIQNLLRITSRSDPEGSLNVARKLKKIINNKLSMFEQAKKVKRASEMADEEDRRRVQRLLRQRNQIDAIIMTLETR